MEEDVKRWLRVIGVPFLFLLVGFGLGLLTHRTLTPSKRFVTNETTGSGVALDTKTGQDCYSEPAGNKDLPPCLDLYRKY
jgi:hypothetical protein